MAKKQAEKNLETDQTEDQIETQETVADDVEPESEDATEVVDSPVVTTESAPEPLDLHRKVEKFVAGIRSSGNPDAVHALNKIEHLTGTLKYSLPAAIAAVEDGGLKSDLETLLKLL